MRSVATGSARTATAKQSLALGAEKAQSCAPRRSSAEGAEASNPFGGHDGWSSEEEFRFT